MQYVKFRARLLAYMLLGAVTVADGVELNRMSGAGFVAAVKAAAGIDDMVARLWRDMQ